MNYIFGFLFGVIATVFVMVAMVVNSVQFPFARHSKVPPVATTTVSVIKEEEDCRKWGGEWNIDDKPSSLIPGTYRLGTPKRVGNYDMFCIKTTHESLYH